MKEGLALVSYDCRLFKLAASCSLEGSYGYIPPGTSRHCTARVAVVTGTHRPPRLR